MRNPSPPQLNLWKQRLGQVPDWVWEQTNLETLVLADNDLTEVSEQIGRLRSLRMLDLGHNSLATLPDALGDLYALDFLYLHDNHLRSLPSSLERLRMLLPEHRRERSQNVAGMYLWDGRSDRAQGVR